MQTLEERAGADKLRAALDLARHGLRVFPLQPRTKRPFARSRGFLDATTDAATITRRWTATPDAEIGVACALSNIVVFDIDEYHGGDRADLGADLDDTWETQTPGPGTHVWFRCTDDRVQFAGTLCAGIDIRHRAYVVAPPSVHPTGRAYQWVIGHSPDDLPLAPVPPSLAARAGDRVRHGGDRLRHDGTELRLANGERNVTLFRIGAALRRYGVGPAAIVECLAALNRHHATEPLSARELERIAASCCRYAAGVRS